ncbi:hypothetical protein HDU76_004348 [Blyttiomyces sp. JEL0837]|nr:hypothetical protein HDU76_004348 [Blyttiomyces sp. JEL0837]
MSSPKYMSGFGNEFQTEALEGALPEGQNSPQKCPYGLYAEQLSGTAFTVPRSHNLRTWLYRIRPSVSHLPYNPITDSTFASDLLRGAFGTSTSSSSTSGNSSISTPNQLRWSPFPIPEKGNKVNFVQGLRTVAGAGDPSSRSGLAVLVYTANESMDRESFYNADGDMLIVPQQGRLFIGTEMGVLHAEPTEIVVIPRGIKFKVELPDGPSRGYILETFDRHWELPDLGPIGANGLANPRDFLYPTASYEDIDTGAPFTIVTKYQGNLFSLQQEHSPFDIVAWHGNYAPFKYDLKKFNTINTVSFDHPDPSIFTVLTVKSGNPGVALADFVIFPPRWMVAENTFRPPYFHRNCMSEFMGLITGAYDAKAEGFLPGGGSLHSAMSAHGPDVATFVKASADKLEPFQIKPGSLAFMFETCMMLSVSTWALKEGTALQKNYYSCWQGMPKLFNPNKKIKKEIAQCQAPDSPIKVEMVNDDLCHLKGRFKGPEGTPYEGGVFEVDIQAICLDILKDQWSPVLTLKTALISLQSLLSDPAPNDPQDAQVARHYLTDKAGFDSTARQWTQMYAKSGDIAAVDDDAGIDQGALKRLCDMGFDRQKVIQSLRKHNGDEQRAVEAILLGE